VVSSSLSSHLRGAILLNLHDTKALFPLQSERLTLDLFTTENITADYVSWLNNTEVMRFSNQRFTHHNMDSCKDYFHSINKSDALFLSINQRRHQRYIGTMTVYFARAHRTADIGILIGDPQVWGQGFGREAWLLLLSTLLNAVNVRKVTAGTLACNHGMLAIMKNCGMRADGQRSQQELIDGQAVDILHFAAFQANKR
ncbi:MAG: GNAT family N-acetyltransferase, partial [Pseudomonadota bacterium]